MTADNLGFPARSSESVESVSMIGATDDYAVIFELEESGTFLIHSCSLYCNALDGPLLCRALS